MYYYHMNNTFFSNFIQKFSVFDDCYDLLEDSDKKEKGDFFEHFSKYFFQIHPTHKDKYKNIYLYDNIPPDVLTKLKLPKKDKGIDILLETNDNHFIPVQCKFRSNPQTIINWKELSTFFGLSFGMTKKMDYGIFITNCYDVCDEVNNSENVIVISGNLIHELNKSFFENMKNIVKNKKIAYDPFKPYDYQQGTITKSKEYYKKYDKGYIEYICGAGKTLTSWWIVNTYNRIIIFVPSLLLLSQFYYDWLYSNIAEKKKYKFLLIGSDMDNDENVKSKIDNILLTTNEDVIRKFIKKDTNMIVICTYQSSHLIQNIIEPNNNSDSDSSDSTDDNQLYFDFGIYDEAHRTVGQKNRSLNCMVSNKYIKKKLFMTATPKMYKSSQNDNTFDDDEVLSMDNEKIYGKMIDKYNLSGAINDRRLCDYQIYNIHVTDKEIKNQIKDDDLLKLNSDNNEFDKTHKFEEVRAKYFASALMIIKAFDEFDSNHMVTYHNSIMRSKQFEKLLKVMFEKYSKKKIRILNIDGSLTMKQRRNVIREFITSKYAIITSARVLNEGINIPIIDSECFVDPRTSTIDIIQCIGRALRLHKDKKVAKIIVPIIVDEINEDIDDMCIGAYGNVIRILQSLKICDQRIIEYFGVNKGKSVKNGRKMVINCGLNKMTFSKEINMDDFNKNLDLVLWKGMDMWNVRLEEVKKYIDKYEKRPSSHDKDHMTKQLGKWIERQATNYKKKTKIMKNDCVYNLWTDFINDVKYKKYFMSTREEWIINFKNIKKYVDEHHKKPSECDKNIINKRMAVWIQIQLRNYKNKTKIMKNSDIYDLWTDFMNGDKYKTYFLSNEDIWKLHFNDVMKYIDKNHKRPSQNDKNIIIQKMGTWISTQIQNYKNREYKMTNNEIYDLWTGFMNDNKYKKYFISNEEVLTDTLAQVKKYIDKHEKRPSSNDKDHMTRQLGKWIEHQATNYKNKKGIMKNDDIYNLWTNFINDNKYKKYFMSNEKVWKDTIAKVKKYIDENHKRPSSEDKYNSIKQLGQWTCLQSRKYRNRMQIMKNDEIYNLWSEFINDDKYKKYFKID